jgi:uncharacterized protein YkwD
MGRRIAAAWLTLGVLALSLCAFAPAASARTITLTKNERTLLALINKARTSRDLHAVSLNKYLYYAAKAHSRQMISKSYFSHDSKAGESFSKRIVRYGYSRTGYSSWSVGEVIGYGKGMLGTPQAIFKAWMKDAAHRKVILAKRWRDVGVGQATGTFKGVSNVQMYTVDFGRRVD